MERVCLIIPWPCCVGLTVPCGRAYKDHSVGRKTLSFMIRVERMGLAQDFVELTPTVAQNRQMRLVNIQRVRIQRNRISFRLHYSDVEGMSNLCGPV